MLPPNVGHTLPRLRYLCVMNDQLEGPIPPSISNASNLQQLDLSLNKFSGLVPPNLGQLQNLSHLTLGYNMLEARDASDSNFLTSLTNCTNLKLLDLSNNALAGNFPRALANLSRQLERLLLADLQMLGQIPREIENLEGLQKLDLSYNLLSGNIPATMGKLNNLVQLTLFGNKFSGPLTASLGNLTQLEELHLGCNNLQGNIPKSFINYMYLNELDLSYNQLSGTIPREVLSISSLTKVLDLSHNSLAGSISSDVRKLNHLIWLDISENKLSGNIPSALGDCVTLNYLFMEGNFFEGDIPLQLSNLKSIQQIDLSHNKLSGQIPEFFSDIGTLQYLNLSFNDFEGPVPVKGLYTNTSEFSVQGNGKLCGGDHRLLLPSCSNERKAFASLKNILIIVIVAVGLIVLLLAILCWKKYPRKGHPSESSSGDQHKLVSYTELHKATDGFSSVNLIGVGSFGSVYKGILDAYDKVVAVKVLNLHERGALKSYLAECEALRNIRHRNLIKIITTCSSIDHSGNDFKALVFEFVPNGSLEEWLHPKVSDSCRSSYLTLAQRLDIAIDVALALEYLHHHHGPTPIVHCDVKPSNVLIDNKMCADFGLARFLRGNNSVSTQNPSYSIALKGSMGYIAPEFGMGAKISTQGDVYSYGILLLELLTGRRPTDDMFKDGRSLCNFVEMGFPERVMEVMDPGMLLNMETGSQSESTVRERMTECLVSMIDIALLCSKEAPNLRLDMQTVVNKISAI